MLELDCYYLTVDDMLEDIFQRLSVGTPPASEYQLYISGVFGVCKVLSASSQAGDVYLLRHQSEPDPCQLPPSLGGPAPVTPPASTSPNLSDDADSSGDGHYDGNSDEGSSGDNDNCGSAKAVVKKTYEVPRLSTDRLSRSMSSLHLEYLYYRRVGIGFPFNLPLPRAEYLLNVGWCCEHSVGFKDRSSEPSGHTDIAAKLRRHYYLRDPQMITERLYRYCVGGVSSVAIQTPPPNLDVAKAVEKEEAPAARVIVNVSRVTDVTLDTDEHLIDAVSPLGSTLRHAPPECLSLALLHPALAMARQDHSLLSAGTVRAHRRIKYCLDALGGSEHSCMLPSLGTVLGPVLEGRSVLAFDTPLQSGAILGDDDHDRPGSDNDNDNDNDQEMERNSNSHSSPQACPYLAMEERPLFGPYSDGKGLETTADLPFPTAEPLLLDTVTAGSLQLELSQRLEQFDVLRDLAVGSRRRLTLLSSRLYHLLQ